jgi:hypothetical protein
VIYGLAAGVRELSTPIRYSDLRFVVVDWVRKFPLGYCIEDDGLIKNPGMYLENTLQAAQWFRPSRATRYGIEDDEDSDETREFCTLFLKDQIRSLRAISTRQKLSTDQLREQVGGRATSTLDLKGIMDNLVAAVDRDDLLRWGGEVVR